MFCYLTNCICTIYTLFIIFENIYIYIYIFCDLTQVIVLYTYNLRPLSTTIVLYIYTYNRTSRHPLDLSSDAAGLPYQVSFDTIQGLF